MATIPEKPQTNLEQYLNRIATGDGEYPAKPRTNVEQYLNYIIENGTGGGELVTELPAEGKEGKLYVLVDDATAPTKAYGVYTYAGGQYIIIAQPIDQSVQKVTTLPAEGQEGVLYYLETSADTYDLYRWINNGWVKVDTDVVLYSQEGNNVDGAMTQAATTAMKGKAKVLTTDDYNYPVDNPTRVALWLLEPGIYIADTNVIVSIRNNIDGTAGSTWIVGNSYGTYRPILQIAPSTSDFSDSVMYYVNINSGGGSVFWGLFTPVVNGLTSTATNRALSANQGKVLKDMIGDLANLSTTDKSNLVAAIDEIVANQPIDFTGTDGATAGTHGLVPAPATTDAGKFLKADGTWDTAGGQTVEPLTDNELNNLWEEES